MLIIDRNTDYYDYLSNIYGPDKGIVFDRRGSERIDNSYLSRNINKHDYHVWSLKSYILLEVGDVQHLIELFNFKFKKDTFDEEVCYDFEIRIVRTFRDHRNRFGSVISLRKVFTKNSWRKNHEKALMTDNFEELFYDRSDWSIDLPILANTKLTILFSPEDIWKDIMNYISSLDNDIDVSIPMTDVEKAETHGFDKKSSFRHPIK